MHLKRFVLCSAAAVLALAIACSKSSETPTSPSVTEGGAGNAAADGLTLKVPAPTNLSPSNGAQPDSLVLTASTVDGKFNKGLQLTYQFQISTDSGSVISACTQTITPDSGSTVSYAPSCGLDFEAPYKWKVRARMGNDVGPWSTEASFKTPSGGYIKGNEVFDPLTNGKTAGEPNGPVQFIPGQGAKLLDHSSFIRYRLPVNLQGGEFSMMIKGADEGTEGDKSKVFAMQEGPDEGDITDDDYRFTAELRGANYGAPGSVTYRIICGDGVSRDGGTHTDQLQLGPLVLLEVLVADRQCPTRSARRQRDWFNHLQLGDRNWGSPVSSRSALHVSGHTNGSRRCAGRDAPGRHLQERLGIVSSASVVPELDRDFPFGRRQGPQTLCLLPFTFAFRRPPALPW